MILASFQVVGTLPCAKEILNRSLKGFDKGFESCFRRLLLLPSVNVKFLLLCVDLRALIPMSALFLELNVGKGGGVNWSLSRIVWLEK